MTKLTDMQLVLLSAAAQRDDGIIAITERLSGAVARQAGERLMRLGLADERPARRDERAWREDAGGDRFALTITTAGFAAIGLDPEDGSEGVVAAEPQAPQPNARDRDTPHHSTHTKDRPHLGTKKAMIVDLMARPEGASLGELVAATGWLPHTTRAALSGMRKAGFAIAALRHLGEPTRYLLNPPCEIGDAKADPDTLAGRVAPLVVEASEASHGRV